MPQADLSSEVGGQWSDVFDWPIIGLHSILTPDGKILSFGTDQQGHQGAQLVYDVWDPATNTHQTLPNTTPTDFFCCCAIVVPLTGDILITGGDARPLGHVNKGVADVNVFDYRDDSVSPSTDGPMSYQRWYPTTIELANGKILVLGGIDINGHGVGMPELYTPNGGWKSLTGAFSSAIDADADYPRAYLAPNGKVFLFDANSTNANHADVMVMDPSGDGTLTKVADLPFTTSWQFPSIKFAPDKVLILDNQGGAWIMDLSGNVPTFQKPGSLGEVRYWSNMVVLADGSVMVSGGSDQDNALINPHNEVQIWNPTTGVWTTGNDAAVARMYHSTTILLPDATVLSLGGGAPGPLVNTNGEIYKPSYLFNADGSLADRPVITNAPQAIGQHDLQQTFTITVDDAADITRLTFIKTGAVTHSTDFTTDALDLSFTHGPGNTLIVTVPSNANVLVPGNWMLFAFNNHGTPSVAATIAVGLGGENYSNGIHDFVTTSGDATYNAVSDVFTLTPNAAGKTGAAFANNRIDLSANFSVSFIAYLGTNDKGGGGISFVLQNDPSGSDAFGASGTATLGAGGIANGLAISLDTFKDGKETSKDHTNFFDTDGPSGTTLSTAKTLANLENGNWHSVTVNWNAATHTLTYSIDGQLAGTLSGDLASQYFGGSQYVHFGFTGATGKATNLQQVKVTSVSATYAPADGDVNPVIPQVCGTVRTNGNAGFNAETGVFLLTNAGKSSTGAVMSDTKVDLHSNIDISFNFNLGSVNGGSAGAAFILQNDAHGDDAMGSGGVGLGARGIHNGLAVALETTKKADVAQIVDTDSGSKLAGLTSSLQLGNLEDGHWHTGHVIWNASTKTLSYYIDGKLGGTLSGDLVTKYFGGSNLVTFGFTGATTTGNVEQVHVTGITAVDSGGTSVSYGTLGPSDSKPFIDHEYDQIATTGGASINHANNIITLTSALKAQAGAAFTSSVIDLNQNFNLSFKFYAGANDAAGDGITFVLHNDPLGSDALGGSGSALGAAGIVNGLGIAFDTHQDGNDIANDHTNFFDTDLGTSTGRLSPQVDLGNIEDGNWHNSTVTWNAQTQTLSYWVDGKLCGSLTGDLAHQYFGGSDLVHFGFTGGTGAAGNVQQVQVTALSGDLLSQQYLVDGHPIDVHAHA